ncbi:MAG: aminopeptidase P family N-terminal domain-containing protein, partial [Alphaproteobacteria bacterium]|nr:aminopeptidase P family N-terminal domain-containing protein [Alphaproteobacteria bacterium]
MNKAHHAEKAVQTAATDGSRGDRLGALRSRFIELGLGGFLIPHADAHQSEYLPPGDERLAWISGFTGSAGAAIVLEGAAAVFVDGRYTLQAKMQVERDLFEICHLAEDPPAAWLERNAAPDTKIGYDPWHYTKSQLQRFRQAAGKAGAALVPVAANPIDHVWADRPAAPASPVVAHEARFAGKSSAEKRSEIAAVLAEDRDRAVILTAADSIAWLFNIRGADVEHSPLPLSFAALEADGTARLFVDPGRLAGPVRDHLEAIRIDAPDALGPYLDGLGGDKARVRICPATAAVWLFDRLQKAGAELHEAPDPCSLPKAVKNDIELEGTRSAHLRDGLAL